ncbi:hypothetical protein N4241_10545 [Riemerella anatipestifer]|uniref:hypothetical protein n=1 Tax=Riemerella anatipestifer TaxID=34085 RepID=UPI0021D5AD4F|nr:hypothetical protein [Riemerella anatipestifer]MCU7571543.1 hypothetical protein [Riemerella anatipestifer]
MKTKIIIGLLAFSLVASLAENIRKSVEINRQKDRLAAIAGTPEKNIIERHYQRDSITHVVFRDKIVANNRGEKQAAIGQGYIDSLQAALKISIDKMEQVSRVNAELTARLQLKEKIEPDGRKLKSHKDDFLALDYYPETDSLIFRYDLKLNEARYWEKRWFLGRRHYYVELWPDDPRVKVNGLRTYRIRGQPQSRWGLGVHAGYGLAISNGALRPTPVIGLGLNYNLINF